MKKLKIALIALMLLGLLVPTPALADGEPTYGTAVVDGDFSEWDLTNDFFADMWRAGRPPGDHPNPVLESKLYLRYDCETNTLYALVLAEEGVDVLEWPDDAWLKIDGTATDVDGNSGNDGTPPDFEWVWVGDELRGYEASTALSEGSHTLSAHIQVFDDDEEQTSAVYDAELEINCQEPETGSLEVTKTVIWGKSGSDENQTFEICITGPSYPDKDCKVAADGDKLTWDDLIPGEYTVTETDPGMGWGEPEITGSPVTVSTDGPAQASVTNTKEGPTAITIPGSSFNAEANAKRVTLTWETGTEVDNAGFNLYRALLRDGPYTQINETLITSEGDVASGASYSFVDATDYGTYYYKLEDVDLYGMTTLHGPVRVTVARPLRRPLYRPSLPEF